MHSRLKEIIREVMKTFVEGDTYAEALYEKAVKAKEDGKYGGSYHSIVDNKFKIDANYVPGTKLIASAGPKYHLLGQFILDTLYSAHHRVTDVVALGETVNTSNYLNLGFYDYMITTRNMEFYDMWQKTVKLKLDIAGPTDKTCFTSYSSVNIKLNKICRSTLTASIKRINAAGEWPAEFTEEKKLNIVTIPLKDGFSIVLNENNLESYWKIFQESIEIEKKENHALIHCAAGIGRTGHFILIRELLRCFNEIFAGDDPVMIAKRIHEVINRMRTERTALIHTYEQCSSAIKNACQLQQYALDKKYITAPEVEPVRSASPSPLVSLSLLAHPPAKPRIDENNLVLEPLSSNYTP